MFFLYQEARNRSNVNIDLVKSDSVSIPPTGLGTPPLGYKCIDSAEGQWQNRCIFRAMSVRIIKLELKRYNASSGNIQIISKASQKICLNPDHRHSWDTGPLPINIALIGSPLP